MHYTDEPKAVALSHLAAVVVVFVLSALIYGLWVLLFKPLAPQSVEEHYDGFSCKDELCVCDNHHRPRSDRFIEGEWEWQASCYNLECSCNEHKDDEDGDTYAPELQDNPSSNPA